MSVEGTNNSKVKSITYLNSSDSMEGTVINDIIIEVLTDMGLTYEQLSDERYKEKYLDFSSYEEKNAITNKGEFQRSINFPSKEDVNRAVMAYRSSGFTLPYSYDKTENGEYVTIKCK